MEIAIASRYGEEKKIPDITDKKEQRELVKAGREIMKKNKEAGK